jgi:hypothetical protein
MVDININCIFEKINPYILIFNNYLLIRCSYNSHGIDKYSNKVITSRSYPSDAIIIQ